MVVVPLSRMESEAKNNRRIFECEGTNWVRIAAGGSLLAGGLLLLTGNRRAGLMTAASGTALALLDRAIEIRERLVNAEGRNELVGDLAKAQAARGITLIELGDAERGKREARDAVAVLRAEVKRTGRADLKAMLDWAARHLSE